MPCVVSTTQPRHAPRPQAIPRSTEICTLGLRSMRNGSENGSERPVHRLGSTGVDLICPLNEVADHLCGKSAVTAAAIVRRHAILDPLRQLGSGQQPRFGRGSHNKHYIEVL